MQVFAPMLRRGVVQSADKVAHLGGGVGWLACSRVAVVGGSIASVMNGRRPLRDDRYDCPPRAFRVCEFTVQFFFYCAFGRVAVH